MRREIFDFVFPSKNNHIFPETPKDKFKLYGEVKEKYQKQEMTKNYLDLLNDLEESTDSKEYLKAYTTFLQKEYNELDKESLENLEKVKISLNNVFNKVKLRNEIKLNSEFVLNLFYEANKFYSLNDHLNINALNMALMIHPNWGYLVGFKVYFL